MCGMIATAFPEKGSHAAVSCPGHSDVRTDGSAEDPGSARVWAVEPARSPLHANKRDDFRQARWRFHVASSRYSCPGLEGSMGVDSGVYLYLNILIFSEYFLFDIMILYYCTTTMFEC